MVLSTVASGMWSGDPCGFCTRPTVADVDLTK
eukprot:CAMPEP_0194507664 /NCGR_PEP_ID=MMETSP0253-20130528/37193_1 /TAXON_ID=2966 /ORGANISM="Noctiluca scintillans" /LENGTH=31 /DNA_ID= /DNA_START= /DNA_END= /DNA_ORIENTATION=